jgi:hypothetical protein
MVWLATLLRKKHYTHPRSGSLRVACSPLKGATPAARQSRFRGCPLVNTPTRPTPCENFAMYPPLAPVYCALFLVMGAGMSASFASKGYMALQTLDWETASAQILSSGVKVTSDQRASCHTPLATYSYKVQGRHFTGQRVRASDSCLSKSESEQFETAFKQGDMVAVYYDPDAPSEALLEPGKLWFDDWIQGIAGVVITVIALLMGIEILRKRR